MPFALLMIGILAVVVGIRDTQKEFGQQLVSDFTGSGNFIYWVISIFAIGFLGYIPELQKFSRAFLSLVILSLLLSNKGFFAQFNSQIQSGTAQAAETPNPQVAAESETNQQIFAGTTLVNSGSGFPDPIGSFGGSSGSDTVSSLFGSGGSSGSDSSVSQLESYGIAAVFA